MRILREILNHIKKSEAARHIIERAGGKRGRIVMRRQRDIFLALALQLDYDVLRISYVFVLLDLDPDLLYAVLDHLDRVLGIDIDAEDLFSLAYVGTKLALIDITVGIVDVSVKGDEGDRAVVNEVSVSPISEVGIDHNDLSAALRERIFVSRAEVVKLTLCNSRAAKEIRLAVDLLAVGIEPCALDIGKINGEALGVRALRKFVTYADEIFGGALFLISSAHTNVRGVGEDLIYKLVFHFFIPQI